MCWCLKWFKSNDNGIYCMSNEVPRVHYLLNKTCLNQSHISKEKNDGVHYSEYIMLLFIFKFS